MSRAAFSPSGFFVLRTPLLPIDELERFSAGLEAAGRLPEDPDGLEQALERDAALLLERLRAQVVRPSVRDALFVGSPALEEALAVWLEHPGGSRDHKLEHALVRYFARMAGRPTPFGLFAGWSVGGIAERTNLTLPPSERNERHSRLDQDYLDALMVTFAADKELRRELVFRPNSSLYRATGQLRYVETRRDGRQRSHHLNAVEDSEPLAAALQRAREGATPAAIVDAVAGGGVSREDAELYLHELVDEQLLVPELGVPVTGPEPLDLLVEELAGHAPTQAVAAGLNAARGELAEIDAAGPGTDPVRYRRIAERLGELPPEVEIGRLFQVDLEKPAPEATLGHAVVRDLLSGVELVRRITPARPPPELQRFRERFAERFEGRKVPLLEALDDDAGVGFPEPDRIGAVPLLEGLALPSPDEQEATWGKREQLLLRIVMDAVAAGDDSVELDEDTLAALAVEDQQPLPDAFAASAVLAAPSREALERRQYRLLVEGSVGPSGARLFGRFAHADPDLRRAMEDHLRAEEALRPDAVFAEIVHLPEGRIGNITCRPVLREYEIPYLGRSGAPREHQIPASDLMVSVVGGSIELHSRRLGRQVLPRLTTAHNFTWRSVPLYRFLCLLQNQEQGGASWDWGPLLAAPFLPRIKVGRLVLSPARWRLDSDELRELEQEDQTARFRAVRRLRDRRRLPRLVALADYDNVLPVDLDNVLSVESFLATLRNRPDAALVELWPPRSELCVSGPEGRFVHELVVPFVRAGRVQPRTCTPRRAPDPTAGAPRSRPPGSEWLYAKLYAGSAVADRLLPTVVAPLVEEVLASGAAGRWFFVRYADAHEHVRLRFRGDPDTLRDQVQPRIEATLEPLLRDGRVWRLSYDTYEREVERYGGWQAIELAERIFEADSDAVLDLLSRFEPGDSGADERWRMALCGASMLMADLGLDEAERIGLLRALRASLGRELRVDADGARRLGERLREHREAIEPLVIPGDDVPEDLFPGVEVLRRRSRRLRPYATQLHALEKADRLTATRADLAASFVHMYVNRLARSAPRLHELVIYDFLLRLYESRAARARA